MLYSQAPLRSSTLLSVLALCALAASSAAEDGLQTQREISDIIPQQHTWTPEARDDNWAILPEAGYSPDQGLNGGFKFTGRDLTDYDFTLDTEFTAALKGQRGADVTMLAPRIFHDRAINIDEYHYYLSPEQDFFGLGNNHVRSPLSFHTIERQRGLATFAYHLTPDLVVAASAGPRQTRIARSGATNGSLPATQDAFPQLTGISGGRTNPLVASVIYNDRTSITHPTLGWSLIGAVEHVNKNLGNDFQFTRYTVDASYLHPVFTPNQVLGLRASGEILSGPAGGIPFFELASLGGSDDMRGFFPNRFLGTSRLLVNAEYRAKLAAFNFQRLWDVQIDGVLFGDMGRVFITNAELSDEFRAKTRASIPEIFEDFRYSYGTGLRIAIGEALVARLDVGFSNEQTALVYLVFGQTF